MSFTGFVFGKSTGIMGDESNRNNGMDQLLLEAMTVKMEKMMDSRIDSFGQELHQAMNQRQRRIRKEKNLFEAEQLCYYE